MIRRLMQQFAGGSTGRRPARGGGRRRGRRAGTGGSGARIGSTVERMLRSRR